MQSRLIDALARQRYAELHHDAPATLLATDREGDGARAVTTPAQFDPLGRVRARLASLRTRVSTSVGSADAFPLWQAARAGIARVEARAETVEEAIEAGIAAVEEMSARAQDRTTDLA
jgi:uncharacterized protein YlxP (DUF503 family)